MSVPPPPHLSTKQLQLVRQEMLRKGAIKETTPANGFYSNLFLVPKKDGGQRPVINLKALNQYVQKQHFKIEGIHNLKDLLQPRDWLAKVDLKDAFFTIPIHRFHRQYLKLSSKGRPTNSHVSPSG